MTTGAKGMDLGKDLPPVPNLALAIRLFASVVSIPTGHVGVLQLFGRVTGEALGGTAN